MGLESRTFGVGYESAPVSDHAANRDGPRSIAGPLYSEGKRFCISPAKDRWRHQRFHKRKASQAVMAGIGGFFPLERPAPVAGSVLAHWTASLNWRTFANARSALMAALKLAESRVLWVPSYICKSVLEGSAQICSVEVYPVNASLQADVMFLRERLRAGEACLTFRAFGAVPEPELLQLLLDRPDVTWIEDCAQTLDPGPLLARFRYFSPRKLMGVPEGGVLVSGEPLDGLAAPDGSHAAVVPISAYLRAMDPGQASAPWYDVYRNEEMRQAPDFRPAFRYVVDILDSLELRSLKAARVRNYARLKEVFPPEIIFPIESECPFGMVIRVDDAAVVARSFQARGIFAQRHWSEVVGTSEFDRRTADSLLTLPIDHRLEEDQVRRMIMIAKEILENRAGVALNHE